MSNFDWNLYAKCYDSILALSPYRDMLQEVAKKSLSLGDGRILDASCGTGNFILARQQQRQHPDQIIGVDSSTSMLNQALEKCTQVQNCSFRLTDLNCTLPFLDESFDQVVSLNTLYAVHKPEVTLREFFRVLKPGGYLLLVNPETGFENGLILKAHAKSNRPDTYWTGIHSNTKREEKLVREALGDNAVVEEMLLVARYNRAIAKSVHFHFFTQIEMRSLIAQAGFQPPTISSTYADQDHFVVAQKRFPK